MDTWEYIDVDVFAAFFGAVRGELILTLYAVYAYMRSEKGVSQALLENCYATNRLDALIHAKNANRPNYYYEVFKASGAVVGPTCDPGSCPPVDPMPIVPDDREGRDYPW